MSIWFIFLFLPGNGPCDFMQKFVNITIVNRYIVSSKMNYEGTTFQFLIEEFYNYKTSFFFQLHLFTVICLAIVILYVYYQ